MPESPKHGMARVLLITNDFPPAVGGIARCYESICAHVPPDCAFVLAPRRRGDKNFDASQSYKVTRRLVPQGRHLLARLFQMAIFGIYAARIVRRERIRLVHIGQLHLGLIPLALRVPYVIYLHGGELAAYMRFPAVRALVSMLVGNALVAVLNSQYTLRYFQALGIRLPRVEFLTAGVKAERFRPDLDTTRIRAAYGLDGQKIILTVARLEAYKGHDMVIRALKSVRQSVGPVRYVIVGSGPEESRLRALASDLGCSEEVIFAGRVPDGELPALYAACNVFIMPSRPLPWGDFEGFGVVFLEAGASGKPVVGGRSGGVPEAVLDGVTGVLVDPTDAGQISGALIRLLLNEEEAARLGMAGRRRIEKLESEWEATVRRIWSH